MKSTTLLLSLAWIAFGCAGCSSSPEKPACSAEQLGKIEAAFVAEAVEACAGKTYETCEALPALREKYAVKRAAWKDCK
jgi:hypothetical protein